VAVLLGLRREREHRVDFSVEGLYRDHVTGWLHGPAAHHRQRQHTVELAQFSQ
jgi:hypothetical protein